MERRGVKGFTGQLNRRDLIEELWLLRGGLGGLGFSLSLVQLTELRVGQRLIIPAGACQMNQEALCSLFWAI
jgi:hypothetical protein